MEAIIELMELAGGVILVFAAGYTFARISDYGEFCDKMMYDDDDTDLTIENNDMDKDDEIIHHLYF